jgi:hypothetical protein
MEKKTVRRFDSAEKMSGITKTPQGYLRVPAVATRTGVFKYRKPDGSIRNELRHPDDVFHADSLATLVGIPVTNNHPPMDEEHKGLLNPMNTKQFMVGYTGDSPTQDDHLLKTTATVTDAATIAEVENGKDSLSCGYNCVHDDESGVYQGEPYDVRQREIRYNHLAIVGRGRAGPEARLQLDQDDAEMVADENDSGESEMKKITLGGKEFQVTPELQTALDAYMAEQKTALDAAADKMKAMEEEEAEEEDEKTKADAAKKEMDKLQAKCDSLESEVKRLKEATKQDTDMDTVRTLARELVRVQSVAGKVLAKEIVAKFDSMDEMDIKRQVVSARNPEIKLDGKSSDYLNAAFDIVADGIAASDKAAVTVGDSITQAAAAVRSDAADEVQKAKEAQRERAREASKKPLANSKQ